MLRPVHYLAPITLLLCASASVAIEPPHLAVKGSTKQLIVDGKPFLILGGELGNSAASTLESMDPIWPRLVTLNLNTVLVPAYWDLIEPREGEYDFALIDGLIEGARRHKLRLVFLWFGSWKNSMSCYAPAWVKTDQERFPRARSKDGQSLEILSPFCEENASSDARAFAAFMNHLGEVDGDVGTVLMVQVENEVGMIPDARDWSDEATKLYEGPIDAALMASIVKHQGDSNFQLRESWRRAGSWESGTWEEVLGPGTATEEIFMAWHFARYVGRVAEAGKREYELPMFVNAALIRPGYQPGQYPSAGPLPHLMDVWRCAAPAIDFLSPDIYFPNFVEWCGKYVRPDNPLFIPEALRGSNSAAYAFHAIGQGDAMGISPFAIDLLDQPERQPLRRSYALLRELAPLILEHQGEGTMVGLAPRISFEGEVLSPSEKVDVGDYQFNVTFEKPAEVVPTPGVDPGKWLSGGIIIDEGNDTFLIAERG
jgi:beta-galactosidase GanA